MTDKIALTACLLHHETPSGDVEHFASDDGVVRYDYLLAGTVLHIYPCRHVGQEAL